MAILDARNPFERTGLMLVLSHVLEAASVRLSQARFASENFLEETLLSVISRS